MSCSPSVVLSSVCPSPRLPDPRHGETKMFPLAGASAVSQTPSLLFCHFCPTSSRLPCTHGNCTSFCPALCFTAADKNKIHFLTEKNYRLKPSHVHKEMGTLLSQRYRQIADTVTSVINFNPFERYPFTTMVDRDSAGAVGATAGTERRISTESRARRPPCDCHASR